MGGEGLQFAFRVFHHHVGRSLLRESEAAGKAGDYIKLSGRHRPLPGHGRRASGDDQSSRASFDVASGGFFAK